jgi:predicted ATPase
MRFEFADSVIDDELFELQRNGERVAVQPKVLQLLLYLVRERGRTVPRRELLDALWGGVRVSNASLFRAVFEARRAISDDAQTIIVTVRGRGFRFASNVTETAKEQASAPAALVGRDEQMTALVAQLDKALASRGSVAWVSGEAGMGKTRVLDEIATLARRRGARAYTTGCHESPKSPPYWPWSRLLRLLAADDAALAARALSEADALAGAAGDDTDFPRFESVARIIAAAAATKPMTLAIDDVQWADAPSLRLLRFIASEVRSARVFVACAYRDSDIDKGHGIGALLGEYGSVAIALRPLSEDAVARLIAALTGREARPPVAAEIFARTGGSPLLVRQLLETDWATRALADDARSIASSVDVRGGLRESIGRHLDAISASSRDALAWAAIVGREFEVGVLVVATGIEQTALLDLVDEAVRACVLSKVAEGRFRFIHGLVATALLGQLQASERATRHRAVAEALIAFHPDARELRAAELAHHYLRAVGTARQAFELATRAARQAVARGDARAAARQWRHALQAIDCLPGGDASRVDVQLELAGARSQAGERAAAKRAFLEAAILARAGDRPDALARAALGLVALAPKDAEVEALVAEAIRLTATSSEARLADLGARLRALAKGPS